MKRSLLFSVYFLVFCHFLCTQNTVPSWYLDTEIQYPRSRFIVAVGEGKSRADAETSAIAGVSLFFNTRAEVRNEAIRQFNEAVTNNTTDFSKKTYISESTVIRSEEEFLGVRFASPYYEEKRQVWTALAYIDKAETAKTYESKITVNMVSINAMVADAEQEAESLYACGLLFRALKIGNITEEYIKSATVIDPSSAAGYSSYLTQIQRIRSQYRTKRDGLTFTVSTGSEDSTGRIKRKLQELLEANGCTVSSRNPMYEVSVRLNMAEENLQAGIFIRSGITVQVERRGNALLSYSKNYPRYGQQTLDGAYNRTFLAIEKDLEENFAATLTALIGR